MNIKKGIVAATVLVAGLVSINAGFKGEPKDNLDKRTFNVFFTEVKEGVAAKKGVADELEFKAGKGMFSQFLFDKFEYKYLKYEITKDSVFTDEENNEIKWVEAEISTTDKTDQTMVLKLKVEDYDITGEIKITKKDKLKKKYEFVGKEKPKKK